MVDTLDYVKSEILTSPLLETKILSGLRFLWIIPTSCKHLIPNKI